MDDRALGTRLKVLLDPPPPGLDAVRATATARRAHRRRRRHTAAAAVMLLLATGAVAGVVAQGRDLPGPAASPAPSAGPPDYDRCVSRPAGPGTVKVQAADPTGTYLAGSLGTEAALLHEGRLTRIPMPGAVAEVRVVAVDRSGTVVGWAGATRLQEDRFPWVYRAGRTTALPVPPGFRAADAAAVNARGDVAGTAYRQGQTLDEVGVVWRADALDSPVVTTPGPEFRFVEVRGITDDGDVVGRADRPSDGVRSYVWRPGGAVRQLDGPAGGGAARVAGVNGGWAFGDAFLATGLSPARWNLTTGAVEVFPDLPGAAVAVSPDGVLVLNEARDRTIVVLDAAGRVHRLPTLGAEAVDISDDGRTISGSAGHPAVWTCG